LLIGDKQHKINMDGGEEIVSSLSFLDSGATRGGGEEEEEKLNAWVSSIALTLKVTASSSFLHCI
jgi:hypothetical protein